MSGTSSIFTGASRYAADFQAVITRAVAIASLPLTQLSSQNASLQDQSLAIQNLESKFAAVRAAIDALQTAVDPGSYDTTTSNASVASAVLGTTVLEGEYRINVTETGSQAIALSDAALTDVADPFTQNISNAATFTLTIEGSPFTVTPASNSLNALAAAINEAGADVTATIVNLGSTASPDYRLSLQGNKYAPTTISLHDGSSELVAQVIAGAKASYQVNGLPISVESDTRSVTLAPGLTVNLLGEGETTFRIERSTSAIRNALSSFATAYNGALDELDLHRGEGTGLLQGQSLIWNLSASLREIAKYSTEPTNVDSLTKLGFTFDEDGHLSFDSTGFNTATLDEFDALQSFLGGVDSSGFLSATDDILDGLIDPGDGLIPNAKDTLQDSITTQQAHIAEQELRIDFLRESLEIRFAAADSLIAALEQKVLFTQGLFDAFLNSSQK